jgi:hypothetical protein
MEASDGLLDSIKNIIDKFLALIKKIVAKFITTMNGIVKSDKYLKKHKDRFREFSAENEFDMDIFSYTLIDNDNYPNLSAYDIYKTDDFSKATLDKTGIEYTSTIYTNFRDDLPNWYDKFRGVVLSDNPTGNESYSSSEFQNELYKKFRNGDSTRTSTTITIEQVNIAYDRFDNYDKTLSHVEKMKSKLIKEYEQIKKDVKNITAAYENEDFQKVLGYNITNNRVNTADYATDETTKKKMNDNISSFIKAKAGQIDTMSTIHAMAFTAKLDAIKEAYIQDKKVLYAALKRINKTHDFRESTVYYDDLTGIIEYL